MNLPKNSQIVLDGTRGVYLPRDFVNGCFPKGWNISQDQVDILQAGPDHEWYWEVWDEVLFCAEWHHRGKVWKLYHDDDLFMYPLEDDNG